MKNNITPFLLASLCAWGMNPSFDIQKRHWEWRMNRPRGKKGSGRGGAGVITRHGWRTKQPDGYYAQQTPLEHMHSAARKREMYQ